MNNHPASRYQISLKRIGFLHVRLSSVGVGGIVAILQIKIPHLSIKDFYASTMFVYRFGGVGVR